jgi:hypothetical protein
VPACPKDMCPDQASYPTQSLIRKNAIIDNSGSVFLWQSSDRYCSDGYDTECTLVDGGPAGPFTMASCKAHLPTAPVNTEWWNGCLWKTENVSITHNVIDFNPAAIPHCTHSDWPACGAGGIFSLYGTPPGNKPGWVIPTELTFFQHNSWSDNTYSGPSTFYAWNQGNGDNPVSWAAWTGSVSRGDKCSSPGERSSGYCTGPFGQDAGSTYHNSPLFSALHTSMPSDPGPANLTAKDVWDRLAWRGRRQKAGVRPLSVCQQELSTSALVIGRGASGR